LSSGSIAKDVDAIWLAPLSAEGSSLATLAFARIWD
jgi:hypothetical protein